jgi:peptidoglycan-associated lipoprotein
MNHTFNKPTSSQQGKTQNSPTQSDIGQADTKEIILLAAGLITLVLGLGGILMYSEDGPQPPTASQEAAEEVSTFQMAKAFATPSSPPATPIPSESSSTVPTEPSLHLIANSPETPEAENTDVYFGLNHWTLSDGAKSLLKTQVETQNEGWTGTLHIDGHTDAQGTDTYNRALGLKRAESVKTYLVSLGIPEETIHVQSFGKDGAVCQEPTPVCFEHNRRAHVAFLPQSTNPDEATLLSMTPDSLDVSPHEELAPMIAHQVTENSEGEILMQKEVSTELVAAEPLITAESLP